MALKYALIREGSSDEVLKILVEKYGESKGLKFECSDQHSKPFKGPLANTLLRIRTMDIFDVANLDCAFYFTDKDRGDFNKIEKIEEAITSVNSLHLQKSIIGIPDPHMEAWLLADQDNVKAVFRLDGTKPLPYSDLEPKSRLENLCRNSDDTELTPPEARKRLATGADLNKTARSCPSFNSFVGKFNTYIATLSL